MACYILVILYLFLGVIIVTTSVDLVGGKWIEKIHFLGRKVEGAKVVARKFQEICIKMQTDLGGKGRSGLVQMGMMMQWLGSVAGVQAGLPDPVDQLARPEVHAHAGQLKRRLSDFPGSFDPFFDNEDGISRHLLARPVQFMDELVSENKDSES